MALKNKIFLIIAIVIIVLVLLFLVSCKKPVEFPIKEKQLVEEEEKAEVAEDLEQIQEEIVKVEEKTEPEIKEEVKEEILEKEEPEKDIVKKQKEIPKIKQIETEINITAIEEISEDKEEKAEEEKDETKIIELWRDEQAKFIKLGREYKVKFIRAVNENRADVTINKDQIQLWKDEQVFFKGLGVKLLKVMIDEPMPTVSDHVKFVFSANKGSVKDTLEKGQTKTYNINGVDYKINPYVISRRGVQSFVKFKINDEFLTKEIDEHDSYYWDTNSITIFDIIENKAGEFIYKDKVRLEIG